ncbi:HNH endonuclease [Actinoallomurus spadix]|uniref:HNH nuclease domain-containing protein n=1 Tax=Actinoallomurus spadix TaxID=79912 RepID=A0ABP3G0J8_9ACTN|nr:HNH endonuclease signature motif containing protein [Actinoallomurus spadix]MCO5990429.1 HNH endonuclease [Actinoallomurus spadix]
MHSGEAGSAGEALEMIQAGIAALATSDMSPDVSGLGDECALIMRAVGELQREAARRLARFEALGGPAADHTPSLAGWLGHRCRLRPWEARQLTAMAHRMHLLGDTLAAFESGEVEYGDVATIAEGIDRAAETMTDGWSPERIAATAQPILLQAIAGLTPAQLRKAACRVALTLDGETADRRRRQIERQAVLNLGQTIDGIGVISGEMGADDLAIVEKAVDAFAPPHDREQPRWANVAGHRRLKGLVTACRIALNAAGRHGYRDRGGAPVHVHVIASGATLDRDVPATQAPPGRTEYGTILTAAQVREMIRDHDARVTEISIGPDGFITGRFTADGQPLNWGRTRRFFTAAQREVYLALYAGCVAEGCDRPLAWADIDHKQAWADGGRTDLDNGQPLCRWHNRHKEHLRDRDGRLGTTPPGEAPFEDGSNDQERGREPPEPGG